MQVRPPAVAGTFYPEDRATLAAEVARFLDSAAAAAPAKAIIAPHAGYLYSGPIAGSAYAALRGRAGVRRVLLLGPAHFVPLRGVAASSARAFATPLGEVMVDAPARSALLERGLVSIDDSAHWREHSLEVQLPFLQALLPGIPVLPLCVGSAGAEAVAAVLEHVWGGEETAIVISSDLSHYLPYEQARAADRRTADAILALDAGALDEESACGVAPVAGLLIAARRHGLSARALDLRSSGDTEGPRDEVVGYGAFAFGATSSG
jgi:hypothetical protein